MYNNQMEFISGNQAVVKGAINVGAELYSGYPITPASEIMEEWGKLAQENEQLKFIPSEDELAAIHHALGGAVSGVPSFTATSGPGLSLMQEGLGLAFAYQAPLVVVDVMRSGPSTGAPTRAGQGEIIASRYGTHGDVYPFVFYPTSVKECYDLTVKAFQVAWQHQLPVIILSDAYLAHLQENVSLPAVEDKVGQGKQEIKHYGGLIKRKKNAEKIKELKTVADQNYRDFNLWGNNESDTLLIGLGVMARALQAFEKDYQIFAPLRVWPFLDQEIIKLGKDKKRVLVIEMNQGQYVHQVKQVLGQKVEFISYQEETIKINKLKRMVNGQ
jgi:2-oxoglutarate ferredoxin oxidoreductase subunit alpha